MANVPDIHRFSRLNLTLPWDYTYSEWSHSKPDPRILVDRLTMNLTKAQKVALSMCTGVAGFHVAKPDT